MTSSRRCQSSGGLRVGGNCSLGTSRHLGCWCWNRIGVVGFCHYSRSRDDDSDDATAEITAIYLLEGAWGKGGGTMLVGEATGAMARAGYTRVTLWVLEGNLRARRFYEARGWGRDGAFKVENRESFELRELRYVRALARI